MIMEWISRILIVVVEDTIRYVGVTYQTMRRMSGKLIGRAHSTFT
jgi:hypothetical protein